MQYDPPRSREAKNGIADENWSLFDTKCFTLKNTHCSKVLFEGCIAVFIGSTASVEGHEKKHFAVHFPTLLNLSPSLILFLKWLHFKFNFSKIKLSFRASSKLVPKANMGALLQDWCVSILQICVDEFISKISISDRQFMILSLMCCLWS